MNPTRRPPSRNVFLLVLLLSLFAIPPLLTAEDKKPISITLQCDAKEKVYTAVVPRLAGGVTTMPLQVSSTSTWLVSIDVANDNKSFRISAIDPAILSTAAVGVIIVFSGDFEMVIGKYIPILKTSVGSLSVMFANE